MFCIFVMVPIKYAEHEDGLMGGGNLSCDTLVETDAGSLSRAVAR